MAASDSLAPYIIKRVEELKEEIDEDHSGSYGFVYKVKVDGFLRIAKKPHPVFLTKVSRDEKVRVLANFKKECSLLSKLRHPNIVQFIGVYYGNGGKDEIALVMEKVEYELAKFLLENSNIHLSTKLSILRDVTYGLVYLHEYNPPIIHRDLTARNVLLTGSYQAKIADVGVAKLMDKAAMDAMSHTKAPGQMFYMPPEACMEKALCTSKLDIFSFGHLSLHTLLGDYPEVYEIDITPEMLQQRTMQRMKRKTSLDRVGSDHCLYPLITQCLLDDPNMRPTTREINSSIGRLVEARCSPISGDGNSCSNPRCQALQHQVYSLQGEFEESRKRVTSFEKTVAHLQQEKNSAMEQCSLAKVEAEIFKSDFEEERKDRTKAQGLLADFQNIKSIAAVYQEQETFLHQERDGAIQERNDLKRELSKAKVELSKRTQAAELKEVLKHYINETDKVSRQRDCYRELYEKMKPLESEVVSSKEVIIQLRARIESLKRKEKLRDKELKAADEQISLGTSVNLTLTTSFEKVKDNLAIAKQDIQELKKAKKSLDIYVKKLTTKTGQQRLEEVEQSSLEKLYDEELQRTIELQLQNQYLEGRITDLTMEIAEHKKIMYDITLYKADSVEDCTARSAISDESKGKSRQLRHPPQQQVMACDRGEETSSLDRGQANRKQCNLRTPVYEEVSGKSDLDNQRKPMTAQSQNVLLIPPRECSGQLRQTQDSNTFTRSKDVSKHEHLHKFRQGVVNSHAVEDHDLETQMMPADSKQGCTASTVDLENHSTWPVGKNGRPLRAGGENNQAGDISNRGKPSQNQSSYPPQRRIGSSSLRASDDLSAVEGPGNDRSNIVAQNQGGSFMNKKTGNCDSHSHPSLEGVRDRDIGENLPQHIQGGGHRAPYQAAEQAATLLYQGSNDEHGEKRNAVNLPQNSQTSFSKEETISKRLVASQQPQSSDGYGYYSEELHKDQFQTGRRAPDSEKSQGLPELHHVVDMKYDQFESKDSSAKDNFTQDKHVQKDQSDDRPQAEESKIPQDAGTGDSDDTSLHKDIDDDIKIMAQEHEQVNRDPSLDMTMVHKPMDPNLVCHICGKKFRIDEIQKFSKHVYECV